MAEIKARIVLKHDLEQHWDKAKNFIPKRGEAIVYEVDTDNVRPRLKIGNGSDTIDNLPFLIEIDTKLNENSSNPIENKAVYTAINNLSKILSSALKYKGSKDTTADLPTSDNEIGDVWNIKNACAATSLLPKVNAGDNVAWNGKFWDVLAGTIDLSGYYTSVQIDGKLANKSDNSHTHTLSHVPQGTVSTPIITVTPNTTVINSITDVGSLPTLAYTSKQASKISQWKAGTTPTLNHAPITSSKIKTWNPGTLCSFTFHEGVSPSASLKDGAAVLADTISNGPNRVLMLDINYSNPTLNFSAGSLPQATFTQGSLPQLNYDSITGSIISTWSAGSVPTLTYSDVDVDDITAWTAGKLPTKGSNTSVVTSIKSATSTQPTFTGTKADITTSSAK